MALSITAADSYINQNVLDIADWIDSDEAKKQRMLNVAFQTLAGHYRGFTIPDEAAYEFAPILAAITSDTMRLNRYGVKSTSIEGISFSFNDPTELIDLIPRRAAELIEDQLSEGKPARRRIGRSVR